MVRAAIGDVGLGAMASSSAAGEAHTAHVCTDGYVPPEVLHGRSNRDESAVYGLPVDVWSAGVVTFEVATMTAFLDLGHMHITGIAPASPAAAAKRSHESAPASPAAAASAVDVAVAPSSIVLAAKRLNQLLAPCDFPSFISYYCIAVVCRLSWLGFC